MTLIDTVAELFNNSIQMSGETALDPRSLEHMQRARAYALMLDYYKGKHKNALAVSEGSPDHNIKENWVKSIVNDGITFLMGAGVNFHETSDEEKTAAELAIDEVWEARPWPAFNPAQFLAELGQNGALSGTAYIRLHVDGDDISLRAPSPDKVDIVTDKSDIETVTAYHIVWQMGDEWHRHRIERNGEMWQTVEEIRPKGAKEFREVQTLPWEYEFPPMFHCKNLPLTGSPYGLPDIASLDANDAVNRVSSDINKILYYHAHPQMVLSGNFGDIKTIQSGAGTIFEVQREAGIDLIEMQSDLVPSREFRSDQISVMHETNGSSRVDPETARMGSLSGFALRLLYGKLLATTELKRHTYGALFDQVNYAVMRLKGIEPVKLETVWPDPLPSNPKEKAEIVQIYSTAGASIEAAAIMAGHTQKEAAMLAEVDQGINER